jgi:hypothetical protein
MKQEIADKIRVALEEIKEALDTHELVLLLVDGSKKVDLATSIYDLDELQSVLSCALTAVALKKAKSRTDGLDTMH